MTTTVEPAGVSEGPTLSNGHRCNCACDKCDALRIEHFSTFRQQLAEMRGLVEELERALQRYGAHKLDCETKRSGLGDYSQCTCGFDAIEGSLPLSQSEAVQEAVQLELACLLQEAVTLAELGDITEDTMAHGWGAWLKQSRAALAPQNRGANLNKAALAPTSQPSRGKLSLSEAVEAARGHADPVRDLSAMRGDCAQPERQGG